jgi:hypothetical protein
VAVVLVACAATEPNPLVSTPHGEAAPADIVDACELANRRCSRCHTIDRVVRARITEPPQWQSYVHRMRLMPTSGIPPEEEPTIVRCLVFRTSGTAGLRRLEEAP